MCPHFYFSAIFASAVCGNAFSSHLETFPKCGFGCVTWLHWHILSSAQSAEVKSPICRKILQFETSFPHSEANKKKINYLIYKVIIVKSSYVCVYLDSKTLVVVAYDLSSCKSQTDIVRKLRRDQEIIWVLQLLHCVGW